MTTYETKFGTAKIISGRELCQGKWGVRAKLVKTGQELFISFDGKPELEAAFPAPEFMSVESGSIKEGFKLGKNGQLFQVHEMDKETCSK